MCDLYILGNFVLFSTFHLIQHCDYTHRNLFILFFDVLLFFFFFYFCTVFFVVGSVPQFLKFNAVEQTRGRHQNQKQIINEKSEREGRIKKIAPKNFREQSKQYRRQVSIKFNTILMEQYKFFIYTIMCMWVRVRHTIKVSFN